MTDEHLRNVLRMLLRAGWDGEPSRAGVERDWPELVEEAEKRELSW